MRFIGLILVSAASFLQVWASDEKKEQKSPFPDGTAGVITRAEQVTTSPSEALQRLKEGNARFLTGRHKEYNLRAQVKATAAGQFPFATIVSCMDSRTSVEHVFDLGLGDVFSIRIAGNIVDEEVLGSLEYAHKVAGAKLIVVMGHSHCGAVKGAVDDVVLGNLPQLLARIKPAVQAVPEDSTPRNSHNHAFVDRVARMQVIFGIRAIRERSVVLRELHDAGKIDIVGAFYDLDTGKVEFYRPLSAGKIDKQPQAELPEEPKPEPAAESKKDPQSPSKPTEHGGHGH
jgi:carbonic anhydrase